MKAQTEVSQAFRNLKSNEKKSESKIEELMASRESIHEEFNTIYRQLAEEEKKCALAREEKEITTRKQEKDKHEKIIEEIEGVEKSASEFRETEDKLKRNKNQIKNSLAEVQFAIKEMKN